MLAGHIKAPGRIELVEVPEPKLDNSAEGGQIIFQTECACLCGSDLPFFEHSDEEWIPEVGHSLHEMTGTVVATNGKKFKVGDRVLTVPVYQQGLFERYVVSEDRVIPLDKRVPEEQALLAQPLGTAIFALKKLPPLLDLDVAIVGQGPMGQLFCGALRNLGAREIIAIDLLDSRLKNSPRMGATAVINNSKEDAVKEVSRITNGKMPDLVIEAVGHQHQALDLCVDLCPRFGRILYFGVPPVTIANVKWRNLFKKNITVHTSVDPDFRRDFPLAMRWIGEGRIDVSKVITHRYPLSEVQTAFETFRDKKDGALKVFLEFPSYKKVQ